MHVTLPLILWALAILIAVAGVISPVYRHLREARVQKRQRRNHGRVVSKARRPMVALYCRVKRT